MNQSIIVTSFIMLFLSYCFGKTLSEQLNITSKLPITIPLGFFVFLGLHELIIFPVMIFHLSSNIQTLLTVILVVAIVCYCLINFKKWIKISFNLDLLLVLACTVLLIVFYYNVDNLSYTGEDYNFYLPFVAENVNTPMVNTVNPWSGEQEILNWIYNFQGYYLFLSTLSNLLQLNSHLVTLWIPAILFFAIMPMCIMNIVNYFFKDMNRWLKYCLFVFLFCFMNDTLSGIIYPFYGNQFRPLIMIYFILLYLEPKNEKPYLQYGLLLTLMFAHFSVQSTGLFIGIMLIILVLIFEVFFNDQPQLEKPILCSIPLALYGIGIVSTINLMIALIALILLLICYVFMFLGFKYVKSLLLKVMKVALGLCLSIFIIGSVWLTISKIESPMTMLNFIPSLFESITYFKDTAWIKGTTVLMSFKALYVLFSWTLIALILFKKSSDKQMTFFKVLLLGTLVYFYNPLVAPFVSKFLTGIVYGRTTIILFSLLTFAFGIKCLLSYITSNKKTIFLVIGLTIISGVLFLNNSIIHAQDFKLKWITPDPRNDVQYKLPYDLLEAHKALNEYKLYYYQDPNYRPVVLSCDLRTRLINNQLKLVFNLVDLREFYANFEDNPYEYRMFLYAIITDSQRYFEHDIQVFEDLQRRLKEFTIEFLIVPADGAPILYDTLNTFATKIYENQSYYVYHISYMY